MITTAMPFPLKSSNGFIADSGSGWVIIDGGVNTEVNRRVWETALHNIGISWPQIKAIYLTHYHHDHLGLAGWMQQQADVPVYIAAPDARMVENILHLSVSDYRDRFQDECLSHDWSRELQLLLAKDVVSISYLLDPLPELSIFPEASSFQMADYLMTAIPIPGHTDGHLAFTGNGEIIFSGDNLLAYYQLHATDWPHNLHPNPLQLFIKAMANLESLPIRQVFPGHGPVFDNFSERIQLLYQHHLGRLNQVSKMLTRPMTAWGLAQMVFPKAEYIHIKRLILAETLAYLQWLEYHGFVLTHSRDGIVYYQPATDLANSLTMEQLFLENPPTL
ncbi:MAG: MBL fold metallo-hydrolase [Methylocystaceae bacterium]